MTQSEILIQGGYVATFDPTLGDLPLADVLIRGELIAEIGPNLATKAPQARVVEAQGRLVIPGLVDAHRHVWQGALGGSTGQVSLTGYSAAVIGGMAPLYEAADIYAGTLWGALQALNAGVTTVADWAHNLLSPQHADANVQALHDASIRAMFLYGGPGSEGARFFSRPAPVHPDDARRIHAEIFSSGSSGRLSMGLALRGPAFTTPEATAADVAMARELGVPISVHVGMAGYPDSVAILDKLGLLWPDINYAHANQLTDHEFDLIAASGGSIAICPSIDMMMAIGSYPATGQALARGIPAGLGVDTTTGAGTDLFTEMRIALAAERSRANAAAVAADKSVAAVDLDHRGMLRLATLGGAEAWHLDAAVGSLTPGKQADIAVVDMRSPHLDGYGDLVTTMVMGAGAADVETVVVGGQIVKQNGALVGAVAVEARALISASRQRLRSLRAG